MLIFKLNFFFFWHLTLGCCAESCRVVPSWVSVSVSVSSALFLDAKYTFYLASDCSIRFLFLYACLCVGFCQCDWGFVAGRRTSILVFDGVCRCLGANSSHRDINEIVNYVSAMCCYRMAEYQAKWWIYNELKFPLSSDSGGNWINFTFNLNLSPPNLAIDS